MALGDRSAPVPGAVARSLAHAVPRSFWLDQRDAPEPLPALAGHNSADLAAPVPFPPEPLRSAVIQMTRSSLARADASDGRRDMWLRMLDRLGLGYDS